MQKSSSKNQCADSSEKRFTKNSEGELSFLLESRQSKTTKNSTYMAVSTFKGTCENKVGFQIHTLQKTRDYSKNRNCFSQGKFNRFHIVIAFAISFFSCNDFTDNRRHEIQASPYNVLRHIYITPISSKILTTRYLLAEPSIENFDVTVCTFDDKHRAAQLLHDDLSRRHVYLLLDRQRPDRV